jgi:hypothetical protein
VLILSRQRLDLGGDVRNALVEPAPIFSQVGDEANDAQRQGIGGRSQDAWQSLPQGREPCRTMMPRSRRKPRIWLVTPVRWLTRQERTRCRASRSIWSGVLIATNDMVGRCTASAMASASR